MSELLVPRRCCGPADSGNGGWTSGALADLLDHDLAHDPAGRGWSPVRVTLRRPPPLDTAMSVVDGTASDSTGVVAVAEMVDDELLPVEEVSAADAAAARTSYAGLVSHPFPTCFACGTERAEGDGLRIWPGRVADDSEGRVRVASTWTPPPDSSLPVTWAALDCVGGWAGDLTERLMVLGRMTARVDALPVVGEPHVVLGGARGREGRKTFTAATLYDADQRVVAVAEHVWVAVDPGSFGASEH